ncbi:SagB-type dehydrogenase domain protein [Pleurocapsa sp. PCC 7327]|uniref:SagB family peptide dehydrogenase n=1 Tax=Pleurocapsa sp. PCC 7327 TaxID=118163 RepID=UPI00029FBBDD|nr:SagB family peptide dehydrogenase [Pleurocapsa sp. PCC 7327]AFY76981.1 SagB-type dehydrogenase domain protein [Pleurocapsa sp. PCC 7327]
MTNDQLTTNHEPIPNLILSFKKDIFLDERAGDEFVLRSPTVTVDLKHLPIGIKAAIAILATEEVTEEELCHPILITDGNSALPQFYYYLQQFITLGWICHTIRAGDFSLATLIPIATPYQFEFSKAAPDRKYVLSRFVYCHQNHEQFVIESPLSHAKVVFRDWRSAAMVNLLAQPQDCRALTEIPGISVDTAQMFLSLLLSGKMLSEIDENGKILEEENETLVQWEFHDLLFHSRSRSGRHSNPVGKTYRFLGKIQPLSAVKTQKANEIIELYKPDLQKLLEADVPLTQVLEQRKSVRIHGDKPISATQLGEFLYRCARIKAIGQKEYIECSARPYPSGGACYELELYIVVNTCESIPSGLYHYCPQNHQLAKIAARNGYIEALLKNASQATGESCLPQILIILTARFARVSWAYESIAYSLILKHVGVLYQTMYLVATVMDLAPCALGQSNSDLFAMATGIDYYSESSVGEFILGNIKSV